MQSDLSLPPIEKEHPQKGNDEQPATVNGDRPVADLAPDLSLGSVRERWSRSLAPGWSGKDSRSPLRTSRQNGALFPGWVISRRACSPALLVSAADPSVANIINKKANNRRTNTLVPLPTNIPFSSVAASPPLTARCGRTRSGPSCAPLMAFSQATLSPLNWSLSQGCCRACPDTDPACRQSPRLLAAAGDAPQHMPCRGYR